MSCMLMDADRLAVLSATIAHLLRVGFPVFGFDAPEGLRKALPASDSEIYRKLYDLNARAYGYRYNEHCSEAPEVRAQSIAGRPPIADNRYCVAHWHYQFAKMLDFYIYQVTERATENDPVVLALQELSDRVFRYIVTHSAEYNALPWA